LLKLLEVYDRAENRLQDIFAVALFFSRERSRYPKNFATLTNEVLEVVVVALQACSRQLRL